MVYEIILKQKNQLIKRRQGSGKAIIDFGVEINNKRFPFRKQSQQIELHNYLNSKLHW